MLPWSLIKMKDKEYEVLQAQVSALVILLKEAKIFSEDRYLDIVKVMLMMQKGVNKYGAENFFEMIEEYQKKIIEKDKEDLR